MPRNSLGQFTSGSTGPRRPLAERFWEKIDRSGGSDTCWPWLASKDTQGYGRFGMGARLVNGYRATRVVQAHRVAYELSYGSIPQGHNICHTCDFPSCCNPRHLFPGTDAENALDAVRKGRWVDNRGSRAPRAKLTEAEIPVIRRLLQTHSQEAVAHRFGLVQSSISAIACGRSWRHV